MNVISVLLRIKRLELFVQDLSFGRGIALQETILIYQWCNLRSFLPSALYVGPESFMAFPSNQH